MKKIKSISTHVVGENTPDEGILVQYEERDEEGHLVVEEKFYPDGSLESRILRDFDDKGQVVSEKEFSGENEQPDQATTYTYSAAGRLEEAVIAYQDGSLTIRKYEQDEAANSETIHIADEEGTFEGKEYRRYDSEGHVLQEVIHDEEEKLEQDVSREYDDHGQLIKRVSIFDEDYETVELFDYERNEGGQIISRRAEDEDGKLLRFDEFSYDERGNTIQHKAQSVNEGWALVDEWEYDEKDQIVKSRRSQPDGSVLQESDYFYNEEGLLLERETRTKQGVSLSVYKYEYY